MKLFLPYLIFLGDETVPAYASVSLGLLHGSQPDAIVVCHDPMRQSIIGCPEAAIRCMCISINTSGLPESERQPYLETLSKELNLPCVDPIIDGCEAILANILVIKEKRFNENCSC